MQAEHHAYKQGITCAVRDPRAGRGPTNMLACFPRRVSGAVCAVLAKPSILALAETLLALSMPCLAATSNNMQWAIECSPTCIKTANVQHGQPPQSSTHRCTGSGSMLLQAFRSSDHRDHPAGSTSRPAVSTKWRRRHAQHCSIQAQNRGAGPDAPGCTGTSNLVRPPACRHWRWSLVGRF